MGITAANARLQSQTKAFGTELNSETARRMLQNERIWRKQGHEHPPEVTIQFLNGIISADCLDARFAEDPRACQNSPALRFVDKERQVVRQPGKLRSSRGKLEGFAVARSLANESPSTALESQR